MCPDWGQGSSQPLRYVPLTRIEHTTLQTVGRCFNYWASQPGWWVSSLIHFPSLWQIDSSQLLHLVCHFPGKPLLFVADSPYHFKWYCLRVSFPMCGSVQSVYDITPIYAYASHIIVPLSRYVYSFDCYLLLDSPTRMYTPMGSCFFLNSFATST